MSLKNGSSNSVVSNIKTLVDDWKRDGSIGTSRPPTKKKAIKQAVAIALSRADKSQLGRLSNSGSLPQRRHRGELGQAGKGL